ncbi:zinc dependent phospholipase C family protein [Paenibacillus radicis (ex Xue et al. 2023)]|uniref:Zinc dependent phospholipase C family protein n=1 Tax=Paenibacillus radicis (ex Xue et al. 2023) TaxID=2972489 RepID=A0ABT1YJ35_9BACL|nr:zinc dependent phospholipase C family protein [Paenibacillus radicis (ex Xue et al. 2023)]MCR8631980.1 zinc dependent phospholipase C family protein [Paenibacillus radicis (ex Xue et al. 2023)]
MGSRIMHLIIANKIAARLTIEDRTSFLLGSIAPDAVATKNESHFFIGEHQDYSRSVDYKGFLNKYSSQAESLYILGYYTHLIADEIWLKGFYLPWLRNRMDADKEIHGLYHNDFRLLNGKLLEHYGLSDELRKTLYYIPTINDLQEVKSKDVEEFVPFVLGDMEYEKEVINQKLNVFMFDQIVGYIETSVDIGLLNLKQAAILHRLHTAREWLTAHH